MQRGLLRPDFQPLSSSGQWASEEGSPCTYDLSGQSLCGLGCLGNLKPLQREGFNWLRLCAYSKGASPSRD